MHQLMHILEIMCKKKKNCMYWIISWEEKYNNKFFISYLSKINKPTLTLVHDNADLEQELKSDRMPNAKLTVSDDLKLCLNKPELVPVTKNFLNFNI